MKNSYLKSFSKGFKEFGETIGIVVNTILLIIVYIMGIGITSVTAKITGKQFLNIKKQNKITYWQNLNLKKQPIEKYYRQF